MNWLAQFGGHYGAFVAPAYGFAVVVLAAIILDTLRLARRWRRADRDAIKRGAQETPPPG